MDAEVIKCPQCGASLVPPSRFARTTTCTFCGTVVTLDPSIVHTRRFKEALAQWRGEGMGIDGSSFALEPERWIPMGRLARGHFADLYLVERVRQPTERALLKVLRRREDEPAFEREWSALRALAASEMEGALFRRVPQPIARGKLGPGLHGGATAMLVSWSRGYEHTLQDARAAFPGGIEPPIAIWIWRRMLELLTLLHRHGLVHGAVLPPHVLIENGEHGARLCGFGSTVARGRRLPVRFDEYAEAYPLKAGEPIEPEHDVRMSAACMAIALGGAPDGTRLPAHVPERLARTIVDVFTGKPRDAWQLRQKLGGLARDVFGPPSFHPLVFPGKG